MEQVAGFVVFDNEGEEKEEEGDRVLVRGRLVSKKEAAAEGKVKK